MKYNTKTKCNVIVTFFLFSDTYNAMSIRRLERDTSVDRMSTGSRGSGRSGMSTQSEWVAGEKKKKAGLIGKLKKLTKTMHCNEKDQDILRTIVVILINVFC